MICQSYPVCTFVQSLPNLCMFYSNISTSNCDVSFGPKEPDVEECTTTLRPTTLETTTTPATITTTTPSTTPTTKSTTTTTRTMTCMEPGQCVGKQISRYYNKSYNKCLKQCKESDTCHWFTFQPSFWNKCMLFEDCPEINTDCSSCLTGERECPVTFGIKELKEIEINF